MITINGLTIQYGEKHLFKNLSARLTETDRIGLVGVNGTGKSTLLKLISGIMETDDGVVMRARMASTGYLPQEVTSVPDGRTVYQQAENAFADILAAQKKLEDINHTLAKTGPSSPEFDTLLKQQGELQHRVEQADLFRIRAIIGKVLLGLGFKESDFDRNCQTLSGGWLMRLMLAKLLLTKPAFLLLDEPTNHLDIDSLTWLEEFLKTYSGALVIISHDRMFLDNLTTSTWELSLGNLTVYKGNYTKYLAEKELRQEIQKAAYDNQQAQIQQTMRFVERFRAKSTKARQVQSRLKQLDKMERIELEDTELEASFRFPPATPSGKDALNVKGVGKSFDDHVVFTDISFQLRRGEKIAVVGVNGAGKSTLAKLIAGLITPDRGLIAFGHNVNVSYFGQHQAQELAQNLTVLETMAIDGNDMTVTQMRSLLGAFLFRGNDVDKKVRILSGGEKSRLALAKMIATPANFLIMDEPTNHLDMMSQEVLQQAMAQYDGTIIVVSHNRFFADQFVNRVLEIKNSIATLFDGNISYYLEKTSNSRISPYQSNPLPEKHVPEMEIPTKASKKETRQVQAKIRQEKNNKLAPYKKLATVAEKQIDVLEIRKAQLEAELADPELYKDQEAFGQKSREYKEVERRLARNYMKWEEAHAKIEEIENKFEMV